MQGFTDAELCPGLICIFLNFNRNNVTCSSVRLHRGFQRTVFSQQDSYHDPQPFLNEKRLGQCVKLGVLGDIRQGLYPETCPSRSLVHTPIGARSWSGADMGDFEDCCRSKLMRLAEIKVVVANLVELAG